MRQDKEKESGITAYFSLSCLILNILNILFFL